MLPIVKLNLFQYLSIFQYEVLYSMDLKQVQDEMKHGSIMITDCLWMIYIENLF